MSKAISSHFDSIHRQLLGFTPANQKYTLKQAAHCVDPHSLWLVKGIYRLVYWCRGKGWINQKKVLNVLISSEEGLGAISIQMKEHKMRIEQIMSGAHYKMSKPFLSPKETANLNRISHFAQIFLSIHTTKPSAPLHRDLLQVRQDSLLIYKRMSLFGEKGMQAVEKFKKSSKKTLSKFDITLARAISRPEEKTDEEWNALEKLTKVELTEENGYTHKLSQKPDCLEKNRYPNILPYDHNVRGESDGSNYVNASIIELRNKRYISTQEPLEKTISDFFNLIIQENVQTIVCLVNCVKESKNEQTKKSVRYWEAQPDALKLKNGYEISLAETQKDYCDQQIAERTFIISRDGLEIRRVTQLHYMNWPDFGAPDDEIFEDFFKRVLEKHHEGPLLCHCSAGVGRTGTFIAIHSLFDEVNEKIQNGMSLSDIFLNFVETVIRMRTYRGKLVQTKEQYQFIKNVIAQWAAPPLDIKEE